MRRGSYLVCVADPLDGVGSRFYGPFDNWDEAERFAAPERIRNAGGQVHASLHPLWLPKPNMHAEPPRGPLTFAADGTRVRT